MRVLIPLSRFRVHYEVGAGRPYSALENLVLKAVYAGDDRLEKLVQTFQVHPRLIVEAVVTLTQVGWFAIRPSDGGLVVTTEGQKAAGSDRLPTSVVVQRRTTYVVIERMFGGVLRGSEFRFFSTRELQEDGQWDQAIRMFKQVHGNELDEAQVQSVIPRQNNEWLRWVGPIDMVSKDSHWLPVTVNLEDDSVHGLPDAWSTTLNGEILDKVAELHHRKNARPAFRRVDLSRTWKTRSVRVIKTAEQHEQLMSEILRTAKSHVLVVSDSGSELSDVVKSGLHAALERGVDVDLLFGDSDGLPGELKRLTYESRDASGRLRFAFNANIACRLLIWDDDAVYRCCVGSYPWFERREQATARWYSLISSTPGLVAALCRHASAMWRQCDGQGLSEVPDRWQTTASLLDQDLGRDGEPHLDEAIEVHLVTESEHRALLRNWMETAQDRFLAMCPTTADVARISDLACMVWAGKERKVDLRLMGPRSETLGHCCSSLVVSDASFLVGNLGPDTANAWRGIGLVVDDFNIAHRLWEDATMAASNDVSDVAVYMPHVK